MGTTEHTLRGRGSPGQGGVNQRDGIRKLGLRGRRFCSETFFNVYTFYVFVFAEI